MSRVVIIGGHGKVALELIPRLVAANHEVRAIIRNPAHAAAVSKAGAEPSVFDIEHADAEAIAGMLRGFDAVVWSAGAGGGSPKRTYAVDRDAAIRTIDAASLADVARFVMVSYIGAGTDDVDPDNSFYAYATAKAAADEHLRDSPLRWTILGPGALTLDAPSESITIVEPTYDGDNATSRANVAAVIERALHSDTSVRKTIRFIDGDTPVAALV